MLVSCVVPAYEAAETLTDVVRELRVAVPHVHVVVVDDGSRDATSLVAQAMADDVARHAENRGKGAALRTGFAIALARGADLVATLDADGQHPAHALPSLIDAARDADIVIGARRRSGTAMPLQRRLSNALSSLVVSQLAGCRIDDSQCGLRVIRARVLREIELPDDRYELETDLLVRAARRGFRLRSVPVPTIYAGGRSHFRGVRDTLRLARVMLRHGIATPR